MADNEIFFFFHEEGIELVYLIVQQVHKLSLCLAIRQRLIPQRRRRRRYELHELLQFLVRQELVPPFRKGISNLLLQPLAKFHAAKNSKI